MTDMVAHYTAREVCAFLAKYSVALLGCGATCIRLERNVKRMAAAYGKSVELTIMPRHIHMTVWSDGDMFTSISTVARPKISYDVNTRLSRLSWQVADDGLLLDDAERVLSRVGDGRTCNNMLLVALVAFANASFCRLFGGDMIAMAVVAFATMCGFSLKMVLESKGVDARVVVMVCAFVSSVLGATDALFSLGTTPDVAMGTSVLYMIPGIAFLNSFSDMVYRHYICAFSRFMDAVVLTCCLSIGLCGGMMLMKVGMF